MLLVAALCIMGAADSFAQGRYRQPGHRPDHRYYGRSGIELSVGYLHSNYKHKDYTSEHTDRDKGLDGLQVALTKDFTLVRRTLYFQTGTAYVFQNSSGRFNEGNYQIVSDRNEHYLDIPVRLKLAMDVMPNLRAFVYAGPTMDFGLSSKLQYRTKVADNQMGKLTYNYYTNKTKDSTIPGFSGDTPKSAYRRFDMQMGFALGVEIYDIAVVKLGFDWGLINKNKSRAIADYLATYRNNFTLGLGVRF